MSDSKTGMDRRGFVKAAGLGTAALGAALAGSAQAEETEAQAQATEGATGMDLGGDVAADVALCDYDKSHNGTYVVNMANVDPIPAIKEPANYDYVTDVVIIGYGVGGTSAALTCANRGVKAIALERCQRSNWSDHAGLHEVCSSGVKEWRDLLGIETWDEEFLTGYLAGNATYPLNADELAELVKFYIAMPQAFEQVRALGAGCQFELKCPLPSQEDAYWPAFIPTNDNIEGGSIYHPWTNKYFVIENIIDRYVTERGVDVLWGTPATNLIMDESGAVVGVKAHDYAEDRDVYIAAKAVIDCVGGFNANYDMLKFYGMSEDVIGCNVGGLVNDGSGMRMCQGAGCGLRGLPRCDDVADAAIDTVAMGLPFNFIVDYPQIPHYISAYTYAPIILGRQPTLKVNLFGRRFMDEDAIWSTKVWEAYKQPNHVFFTIFDGDIDDMVEDLYHVKGRYGMCERPITDDLYIYFSDDEIVQYPDWHEGFQDGIDRGFIEKADTLEELAEKLGINVENFLATVERYNELCDAGEDVDFGKRADCLYPVKNPPFYGLKRKPGFDWTQPGGVATDGSGHVMTQNGTIIPGLFCGAADATIIDAVTNDRYTDGLFASAGGTSQTHGYIAATTAADLILAGELGAGQVAEAAGSVQTAGSGRSEAAEAGYQYARENCMVCHSMPTSANFGPYQDAEDVEGVFARHDGVTVADEDVANIAAWVLGE